MSADHDLVPGQVPSTQFDLLLAGTSIRGVEVIAALRDHLVNGLSWTEAWTKYGVNKGQFSRRLIALQAESARAKRLSVYYKPS